MKKLIVLFIIVSTLLLSGCVEAPQRRVYIPVTTGMDRPTQIIVVREYPPYTHYYYPVYPTVTWHFGFGYWGRGRR